MYQPPRPEMRPVAAERIGGEVAVARSAVEVGDPPPVSRRSRNKCRHDRASHLDRRCR